MIRNSQPGDDHFHDECGVFAVFGHEEAAKLAYLGLYALQHRGQESAGIVATDGAGLRVEKGMGLVQDIFTPDVIADRKSTRLNSSHVEISYAVFCLKKKKKY